MAGGAENTPNTRMGTKSTHNFMDKDIRMVCGPQKNLFFIFDRLLIGIEVLAGHPLISHLKDTTAFKMICPL
jgi:hypothetical protein